MTEQEEYVANQKAWLKATGLQVGDMVKVIVKPELDSNFCCGGWTAGWSKDMYVGAIGIVTAVDNVHYPYAGIQIKHDGAHWWYPFYVLVKI